MPKLINQNFLTLPQQVGKNKKDIEALENNVTTIQTEIDKLVVGDLVVQILNPSTPIVISGYGITSIPVGVQSALLEYITINRVLTDKKAPLYVNLKVMGGFVPDVNSTTDYAVLFTTTTNEERDSNRWLFRAVGYSQNVRFEIYAYYQYIDGVFSYETPPEVLMVSLISNSVFYTQPDKIVGGVVAKNDLLPNTNLIPPQKGDMIIVGNGVYTIASVIGSDVILLTQSGFVAPSGALTLRILMNTSNTPNDDIKIKINKITGVKIFNVDGIAGISMEEQINALGLEFRFGSYILYDGIGSESDPTYISRMQGYAAVGIVNTSGNPVTLNGLQTVAFSTLDRTTATLTLTNTSSNTSSNPVSLQYSGTITPRVYIHNLLVNYNSTVINNNNQFAILFKF